jgi:trans-aconitate 2-methyltransferase
MTDTWDPDRYLQFGDERTRPAVDLVSRIRLDAPRSIVDLGCGPGNSTQVLKRRWPDARVVGIDSSPEMIEAACKADPDGEWVLADLQHWCPREQVDLVFSNATLQWVPDHEGLVTHLFGQVAAGGALAFQIPCRTYALVRTLIHEVAHDRAWASRMARPLGLLTMEPVTFYYDRLAPLARSVDAWETEYLHVLQSHAAVVDWIAATGLRPFLQALDTEEERRLFVALLTKRVSESYEVRPDGRVLLPFRRMFVIAYK